MNDDQWHWVEIKRNRMETILTVDGQSVIRIISFGSDFEFGNMTTNSYVYFGGLPLSVYDYNLQKLALPSSFFKNRYNGRKLYNLFVFTAS